MKKTATRTTWKNYPIDNPERIDITLRFSGRQFSNLKKGSIPRQMEDKWFIFYENDWLYFHRSWTGFGIFRAQLIKEEDGYTIKEFWAERNKEKYKNENAKEDIETISFLIAVELLRVNPGNIFDDQHFQTDEGVIRGWSKFGNLLFIDPDVDYTDEIKSVLFGVAVGDALGVPVEFEDRQAILQHPVTDMIGYGTHNQPAGTFSDDSSLTFCLAESLCNGFDLNAIAQNFVRWCYSSYWTPAGDVFDIGLATRQAIDRLVNGVPPDLAGGSEASSNGNGSLMRIAPLLFYLLDKPVNERWEITKQVSSITHRHIRSVIACFYYLEFARQLLAEANKFEIYKNLQTEITSHLTSLDIKAEEIGYFDRLLKGNIYELAEKEILSSGYVVETLEAGIWCLLTTGNYTDAVLKAVNLGDDTDTTAAVTGGLAGLLHGLDSIPENWKKQLVRNEDIEDLSERRSEAIAKWR